MATMAATMVMTAASTTTTTTTTPAAPEDPAEALNNWSSLIGIVTAIVGNVLIALALNVQRYAHTRLNKERVRVRQRARAALKRSQSSVIGQSAPYGAIGGHAHAAQTNGHADDQSDLLAASYQSGASTRVDGDGAEVASTYLKSPYWWLGQILITLGEMGNFLAYGFAPASIVSPLGVVALISNCIIAPVMFHERFRIRNFWGVVIAIAGVVTVVLSAKQEETKLEPHDVWDAITTMEFEIYLGVTVLLILVLMWASSRYGRRTILIDLGLVGLFGGYTALATKGVSSMLSSTLWRAFTTPVTYALILILLVTAVMQIRYVNKALQRFDSTQVIPIQFVLFTLCVIVGSAILYRDFEKTTAKRATKFVGGCLLTFFGVFLITSGRQRQDDNDDHVLSDAEGVETIGLMHHEANAPPRALAQEASTPKSQSRQSSRLSWVSFAETVKPGSPPDDADAASMRHAGPAEGALDLLGEESSPLPSNPWRESWDGSEPGVETGALSADSVATASAGVSTSTNSLFTTPMRDSPLPLVHRAQNAERPSTSRRNSGLSRSVGCRRSKTFISPSLLSSTVTTVVKDAFLGRYNDSPAQRPSLGRLRSRIRAGLFFNDEDKDGAGPGRLAVPASDDHLPRTLPGQQGEGDGRDEEAQRRKSRRVRDALGDLFRPRKKKWRGMPSDGEGADADADGSGPTRTR